MRFVTRAPHHYRLQGYQLVLLVDPILVDPDNDVFTAINTGLFFAAASSILSLAARFNRFCHAPGCFHFSD